MDTSYIRTMSNFQIFVKTPLIFPVPWAPAPFPERGVRALVMSGGSFILQYLFCLGQVPVKGFQSVYIRLKMFFFSIHLDMLTSRVTHSLLSLLQWDIVQRNLFLFHNAVITCPLLLISEPNACNSYGYSKELSQ